jgi:copper chaperone NosL
MVGSFFLPIWKIELWAPQYPEGLMMKIWLNHLSGDVEIINGLNHYIGMAHIKAEMFPEFTILPYLAGFFVVLGLLVAWWNRRIGALVYLGLIILAGIVAMVDFYLWGYQYGHNLDPNAAIKVPGMAYQPPLIGYKQLLNFGAYSVPDWGGYLFIFAGATLSLVVACEYYFCRDQASRQKTPSKTQTTLASLAVMLFFWACTPQPSPIQYGHDQCAFCKMTIMDQRFGAELVTTKGKVYKFDDLFCLHNFYKANGAKDAEYSHILVNDYSNPGALLDLRKAQLLKAASLRSPMAGNVAAFLTADALKAIQQAQDAPSETFDWSTFQK